MWNLDVWKELLLIAVLIVGTVVVTKYIYQYFGEEEEKPMIRLGSSY